MRVVLTPTGARPEAFSLCQKYIFRQEVTEPIFWIVVDDGAEPQELHRTPEFIERLVIRPTPLWKLGEVTQQRNMQLGMEAALDRFGYDAQIAFWEDDDHYEPVYLETIFKNLVGKDIIGESHARYYNVTWRRYLYCHNSQHASLRSTAITQDGIKHFVELLKRPAQYYDLQLWQRMMRKQLFRWGLTTGIKAMPGRQGIAPGHSPNGGVSDPELMVLQNWIGDDAEDYRDFCKENFVMSNSQERQQMMALKSFPYGELGYIEEGDIFQVRNNKEVPNFIKCKRARPLADDEVAKTGRNNPNASRQSKKKKATKTLVTNNDPLVENNDPAVETKTVDDKGGAPSKPSNHGAINSSNQSDSDKANKSSNIGASKAKARDKS